MLCILDDNLLQCILNHIEFKISLLTGLTCKRFYKILKNIYNKPLQFYISYPYIEYSNNILNLLIYSHKYQIKKKAKKKSLHLYTFNKNISNKLIYFNLWDNYLIVKFALNNNFRKCFTYALENELFIYNYPNNCLSLYISATFKFGTIHDVKLLAEKITFDFKKKKLAIITAVENHKIDCLDYILENIEEPERIKIRTHIWYNSDHLHTSPRYNRNTAETAAYLAARIGSFDSLKAIYDNNYKFNKDKCKHICNRYKSYECLEYIHQIENEEYIEKLKIIIENNENFGWWKPITCLNCAKYGYLEGIKYAVQNYLYYDYDRCLETAKSFDNQDSVNYLLDLG